MKNKLPISIIFFRAILLVTCFMLAILVNKSMASGSPAHLSASARVAVNFKHNVEKNELKIMVKTATEAVMQLFLFTPDGILIKEVAVSAHTNATVKGIKKGFYLYECFDNDERMKSGSLIIK